MSFFLEFTTEGLIWSPDACFQWNNEATPYAIHVHGFRCTEIDKVTACLNLCGSLMQCLPS